MKPPATRQNMLCDICKKAEATIHIREFCNGESRSLNLCEDCARKRCSGGEAGGLPAELSQVLENVRSGRPPMEGIAPPSAANSGDGKPEPEIEVAACPLCGFKPDGSDSKPRCPECYRTNRGFFERALGKCCGEKVVFQGEFPDELQWRRAKIEEELRRESANLERLSRDEDYHGAIKCRDRIRELQAQLAGLREEPQS